MSWRVGSGLFWEFWPIIKARIPDVEDRAVFTRDLVEMFLEHDVDPCDMRGGDQEIDLIMDDVDPEA